MGYRGESVPIPFGEVGLTGDPNIPTPSALTIANNVAFRSSRITRRKGLSRIRQYNGQGPIIGLHDWKELGDKLPIVIRDKYIHSINSFSYSMPNKFTLDSEVSFVEGGNEGLNRPKKLFIFSQDNQPLVMEHTGVVRPLIPVTDWLTQPPSVAILHKNRLVVAHGDRVYFSASSDHEKFLGPDSEDDDLNSTVQFLVYPGEGQYISALATFKGLLIIWKYPYGMYTLDTTHFNFLNWSIGKLSDKLGCINNHAKVSVNQDIIFMDAAANLHITSAVDRFGDISSSQISKLNYIDEWITENFNINRLQRVRMLYDEVEKEVIIAFPGKGSENNNRNMVIDLNGEAPRFVSSDIGRFSALSAYIENSLVENVIAGDSDGVVWKLNSNTYSVDGSSYVTEFQTTEDDLEYVDHRYASLRKHFHELEVEIEQNGNWSFTVDVIIDGKFNRQLSFRRGDGQVVEGFQLSAHRLATITSEIIKKRIGASGRSISLKVRMDDVGRNFVFSHVKLYFKPIDRRVN